MIVNDSRANSCCALITQMSYSAFVIFLTRGRIKWFSRVFRCKMDATYLLRDENFAQPPCLDVSLLISYCRVEYVFYDDSYLFTLRKSQCVNASEIE